MRPAIFLCEGPADAAFIRILLERIGAPDPKVYDIGGVRAEQRRLETKILREADQRAPETHIVKIEGGKANIPAVLAQILLSDLRRPVVCICDRDRGKTLRQIKRTLNSMGILRHAPPNVLERKSAYEIRRFDERDVYIVLLVESLEDIVQRTVGKDLHSLRGAQREEALRETLARAPSLRSLIDAITEILA